MLRKRLKELLAGRGLCGDNLPLYFLVDSGIDFSNGRNGKPGAEYYRLKETILVLKPILTIFDSLIRFHSASENDATEIKNALKNVEKLFLDTESSVVFAHHLRKGSGGSGRSGDRIRGSSDLRGWPDFTCFLDQVKDCIEFSYDKTRWVEKPPSFNIRFVAGPNKFKLEYAGGKVTKTAADELRDIWNWLLEQLVGGPVSRHALIDAAERDGRCSTRQLDRVLSWRVENGDLEKIAHGRRVLYQSAHDDITTLGAEMMENPPEYLDAMRISTNE